MGVEGDVVEIGVEKRRELLKVIYVYIFRLKYCNEMGFRVMS